jgi:hypothetical protein
LKSLVFALALLLPFTSVGCGDDEDKAADPHENVAPDCADILKACHDKDPGEGPIHDCHNVAEANNATACAEDKPGCLSACAEAE